jgi:hypothetical protein
MSYLEIKRKGSKIWGYIVQAYYDEEGRKRVQYLRQATQKEIHTHLQIQKNREELVPVVCSNPECNKIFKIPKNQKRKFFTTFPLRYGRFTLPYCSSECRDAHMKVLTSKCKSAEKQVLTSS